MTRRIEIVVNPASGSKLALSLAEQHVQPLLISSLGSVSSDGVRIRQTESVADGVRIGVEIACEWLGSASDEEHSVLDLVLIGGDGTTHEVLNGLYLSQLDGEKASQRSAKATLSVRLAIVPGGTANALYSGMYPHDWTQEVQYQVATASSTGDLSTDVVDVMLKSVRSLASSISSKGERLAALPLILNHLEGGEAEELLVSHLVTSHALHAAILHDADTPEMRAQHKGIERFKAAAQMNATRWTHGRLSLHTRKDGGVQRYSPPTRGFEPVDDTEMEGPFLYLNAMVTDRLESAFIPAPLSSAFATSNSLPLSAIDVVVIRPRRDPSLSADVVANEAQAGIQFATTRLGEITTGMYSKGAHIDLTFEGGQEPVVEYFRCSGYTFTPQSGEGEEKGRLVCTDGFISSAARTTVSRWTGKEEEEEEAAAAGGKRVRKGIAAPLVWL
ncbi:hypothetical protein EX895_002341 [Sporisorium graminicola]|uniref:DAGKc domain-containing protein n=1 Tax=Sporisorium graminicola TaxID=280036 RepID=A0A4U7KW24_9BASI|nr:hypothetical protein EX895_002341 [Sporisorium graminicola]TKY88710.1 hypothetical protein EX895_002341 [Sporisorium graminicola]